MGFVFRNEAKPLSHLLTFVLIVCHLVRLVNGLLVWLRGLDYFHSRDQSLSIFQVIVDANIDYNAREGRSTAEVWPLVPIVIEFLGAFSLYFVFIFS